MQLLVKKNGLLLKKWVLEDNVLSQDQLVLPSVLRKQVLCSLHNDITSAHLGVHLCIEFQWTYWLNFRSQKQDHDTILLYRILLQNL